MKVFTCVNNREQVEMKTPRRLRGSGKMEIVPRTDPKKQHIVWKRAHKTDELEVRKKDIFSYMNVGREISPIITDNYIWNWRPYHKKSYRYILSTNANK